MSTSTSVAHDDALLGELACLWAVEDGAVAMIEELMVSDAVGVKFSLD